MTQEARIFLINYSPKVNFYTSKEEIDLISNELGLEDMMPVDFQYLRDEVVEFYTHLMSENIIVDEKGNYVGRTDEYWKLSSAMSSVTAVIDHYMYK